MVVSKSAPDQDFAITNLEVVIGNQKNNILHENNSQLLSNVIAIAPNAVSQAPSSSHVVQGENSKIENQNMPASQRQDTSALALSNTTDKTTAFPRNNGMGKPSLDPNRPNSWSQILQTKQQVSYPAVGKEVPEVMPIESANRFAELKKEEDSPPNNCSPSRSQEEQVSASSFDNSFLKDLVASKSKKKKKKKLSIKSGSTKLFG
ncbi:unnamed protein product [Ilex paraguariensis]|uniref:Uncharacterized protein n=1 Tax=Ilex paraguariensis TaxID=185542 RepID=A0ABC8SNV3_9AQUA